MKNVHKKVIGMAVKDGLPFVINQIVSVFNGGLAKDKDELSKNQLGQIEKMIKKVSKEGGSSLSIKTRKVEEIGLSKDELGRRVWEKMHEKTAALPKTADEKQVKQTMKIVETMIEEYPCGDCRKNAKENMKEMEKIDFPIDSVKTRTDAIKWGFDFHNLVNSDLKKENFSIEELETKYDV